MTDELKTNHNIRIVNLTTGDNVLCMFGEVINEENSDGRPDTLVARSNTSSFSESNTEYKDYTFTIDNLPSFKIYRIKLVLTSTDQVFVPKVRDLRVLALA